MAQRVHIVLEDDIDGGTADETVRFGLDGAAYEADLSTANAAKLRAALAPYVAAGRRSASGRGTRKAQRSRGGSGPRPSDIRSWARANGYKVSERGRVPAKVKAAYEAAN